MAELVVSLAAGASHGRLGHVQKREGLWLGAAGFVGAFAGACVLTSLSTKAAKPVVAVLLMVIGIYLLVRFVIGASQKRAATETLVDRRPLPPVLLALLGVGAGFFDAIGGGGWGPIVTPTLLMTNRMEPRNVVGTSNSARFLVSLGAISGFLATLHGEHFMWSVVIPLSISGIIAAPVAAVVAHKLPSRVLGVSIAGLILFLNGKTLIGAFPVLEAWTVPILVGFLAIWAGMIAVTVIRERRGAAQLAAETA